MAWEVGRTVSKVLWVFSAPLHVANPFPSRRNCTACPCFTMQQAAGHTDLHTQRFGGALVPGGPERWPRGFISAHLAPSPSSEELQAWHLASWRVDRPICPKRPCYSTNLRALLALLHSHLRRSTFSTHRDCVRNTGHAFRESAITGDSFTAETPPLL